MRAFCALLVSALALCASAVPTNFNIVPVGKELIYEYEAVVHTGTKEPVYYASDYNIHAKIHLQGIATDMVSVQMTDIVTSMRNGMVLPRKEMNTNYLPVDSNVLLLPFQIQYDANGRVIEIIFEKTDMEWSMNLKQSMASMLQFDYTTIDVGKPHVAKVTEEGINGPCQWYYYLADDGTTLKIKKMLDPQTCKSKHDLEDFHTELTISGERFYHMERESNSFVIKELYSTGQIILHPNRAGREVFISRVLQNMTLAEQVAVTTQKLVQNQVVLKSLRVNDIRKKCDTPVNTVVDWLGGNVQGTVQMHVEKIHEHLEHLSTFMDKHHLDMEQPNIVDSKLTSHIIMHLEYCDLPVLEQTFVELQEKSTKGTPKELRKMNLFVQLLPHVGTRQSVIFIRNLIRKQKINDVLAVRVVKDLTMNVECANDQLLHELEDMLSLGVPDSNVHRACVLAFATLIHRTYEHTDGNSPVLEKYISMFTQKMQDFKEYSLKVLYLQALANIRVGSIVKHLEPFILGTIPVEERVRVQAIWAVLPRLTDDHKMAMRVLVPVLFNRDLSTEVRLAAYTGYVKVNNPSMNHFMNLFWFMLSENDEIIYNFHYNTMESLAKSANIPWNNRFAFKEFDTVTTKKHLAINEMAKLIIGMSRKPMISRPLDGIHITHFKYNQLGVTLQTGFMNSLTAINFFGKIHVDSNGYNEEVLTIVGRIENRDNSVQTSSPKEFNREFITSMIKNKQNFDLIVKRQGRTVMTLMDQPLTKESLVSFLAQMDLFNDIEQLEKGVFSNQLISMPLSVAKYITNDLGQSTRVLNRFTALHSIKVNINREKVVKVDLKFKMVGTTGWFLGSYNPISHVWQGVQMVENWILGAPLVLVAETGDALKITMKKVAVDDVVGMKVHGMSETFVMGLANDAELKKYCVECNTHEIISRGAAHKKTLTIAKRVWDYLGKRQSVMIYDCEHDISRGSFVSHLFNMGNRLHGGIETTEMLFNIIQSLHLPYSFQTKHIGNCGIFVGVFPMDNVDRVEFWIKPVAFAEPKESKVYLKPLNMAFKAGATIKSADDAEMWSYDTSLNFAVPEMHRSVSLTVEGMKKVKGVDTTKMVLDINAKLDLTTVDSSLKLSMGPVNEMSKILLNFKGKFSEEQQTAKPDDASNFKQCKRQTSLMTGNLFPVTYSCIDAMTALRHYVVDVSVIENHNSGWVNYFMGWIEGLSGRYFPYKPFLTQAQQVEVKRVSGSSLTLDVIFPMRRDEVDVKISNGTAFAVYEGLPFESLDRELLLELPVLRFIQPDNYFYGMMYDSMTFALETGVRKSCKVGPNFVMKDNMKVVPNVVEQDWTVYVKGDSDAFIVWVKKGNEQHSLLMKVQVGTDILEEVIDGSSYKLMVNGQQVAESEVSVNLGTFQITVPYPRNVLIVGTKMYGLNIIHDEQNIQIDVPAVDITDLQGKCIVS